MKIIRKFGGHAGLRTKHRELSGGGKINISSEHQLEIILRFSVDHFQILEIPNSSKLSKMNYKLHHGVLSARYHLRISTFESFSVLCQIWRLPHTIIMNHLPFSHEIHNTCHLKWEIFHTISGSWAVIFLPAELLTSHMSDVYRPGVYFEYCKICCRDNLSRLYLSHYQKCYF